MLVAGGSTDVTTYFWLRLVADDTAATGLTITGFDLQYVRSGAAPVAKVDATALAATDSAHADNKAIEIDATDQPGLYRVDWPDAAFAAGVREVILSVKVATAFTEHLRVEIDTAAEVWTSGTRTLTANTNLNDPTAAAISDTVWNEDATAHQGTGSFGRAIGDPGANTKTIYEAVITNAVGASVAADIIAVKADTAAGLQDTNEIQGKLPTNKFMGSSDGADDDGTLNTISTNVSNVETDTQNIQSRLPTSLVNSRMDATIDATGFEDAAVDKVWDEAMSGHQTQGTTGAAITMTAYLGPNGPGVYIDDGAANTGTTLGDDGTVENPVSTIAAATTVASALGVQVFYLINDTVITLAQAYEGYVFVGIGLSNKITLGSSDVDNSEFYNLILTGTQGGTGQMYPHDCSLTALASAEIIAEDCWLSGNIGLRAYDNHMFKNCCSAVAGDATPDLTFPGSGTTKVSFRSGSGGLTLKDGTANDTISYEVAGGQLIIDASCTGLTVRPRGVLKITDNGTSTDIELEAAMNLTNINAEVVDALAIDTYAELAAVPAATSSIKDKINWLFALARNKGTQTSTTKTLRNDADGADIASSTISDDSTTFTRGEWT